MRNRIGTVLAGLALGVPSAGGAEVVEQAENGFVVRQSVEVPRSPSEVWAELLAPAKWWDKAHTWSKDASGLYIDAQATGCFCELMPKEPKAPEGTRRGSVEHMHVVHVNPNKVLLMEGGLGPLQGEAVTGKLVIILKPGDEGKTRIFWEYVVGGYFRTKVSEIAPAVDGMLGQQLARLAQRLTPSEDKPTALEGEDKPVPAAVQGKAKPAVEPGAKDTGN
ncbi:SRPBCC family protein [Novosphingobium sp.]|uniref:SRPBCC family protein n=1 Tax=Novosphingobium sp. TaxID=1874826 RepID=UPI0035B43131